MVRSRFRATEKPLEPTDRIHIMNDEEADPSQDELFRLQIENARLRDTIDRLERQRRQESLASAKTEAKSKKIGHLWLWLSALAFSNICYGLALVLTLAQAEIDGGTRSYPWAWTFIFVFASPLLLLFIIGLFGNRIERYILNHTRRTAQQQRPRNISRRQVSRD